MSRKGFLVKVELDIQKVSCPGVWLCSNGKVSLNIYMLDSSVQTCSCKPTFPIYFHEKYVFYKTFANDRRLNELQTSLTNEWFYAELVQWQSCDEGCVLATFQSTLDDLLYPSSFRRFASGLEVDLLMDPTELFPGTIAPKLEICTKTTIEETLCDIDETSSTVLDNPKLLLSAQPPSSKRKPRKVCHSVAYSRAMKNIPKEKKCKPIFQYRKVNDDLILRNNPNVVLKSSEEPVVYSRERVKPAKPVCNCYCNLRSRSMENMIPTRSKFVYKRPSPENVHRRSCRGCSRCNQERDHGDIFCPICNKYQELITSNPSNLSNSIPTNYVYTNVYRPRKLCAYCKQMAKFHVRSSTGSPCESDISEKKVCFCVPTEKTSSLAQQLHERLSRTLDSNRRYINCIDSQDAE